VTTSRKRIIAALAFVLPVAALVAAPASATTQKPKHHSTSVHKASAHKSTSHKAKHTSTPSS
jgi:hypothetical protein